MPVTAQHDGRRKKWLLAIALGTVGIIVAALLGLRVYNHLVKTSSEIATAVGEPLPVMVRPVTREKFEQILGAEASAGESQLVPIRISQQSARVSRASLKLGDIVKKGEILFELDNSVETVALESTRNQLEVERTGLADSKRRLQAVEELYRRNLAGADDMRTATKDYLDASARVNSAKVKLQQGVEDMRETRATAPVTGVVTQGELYTGMVVRGGVDVVKLSAVDPIHVNVKLSEDKIKHVHIGQAAEIAFYAFPQRTFHGKVARIDPTVDEKTRLFSVPVRIDNPTLELMPGMNGVATLKSNRTGLRIPAVALMSDKEGSPYVFVVDAEQRARIRRVRLGERMGGFIEVDSGLDAGEQVVVVGQGALKESQTVRIGTEYAHDK